jgi:hypothetical protein
MSDPDFGGIRWYWFYINDDSVCALIFAAAIIAGLCLCWNQWRSMRKS